MKSDLRNFYELDAWVIAHQLVIEIYKITSTFPRMEIFGLVSQMRRAAVSITANIAEGFERFYPKDKRRFYYQARGSDAEIHSLLIIAKDLNYLASDHFKKLEINAKRVGMLINGLINSTNEANLPQGTGSGVRVADL